MVSIRRLTSGEGFAYLELLIDILVDCVEGGASVSFMSPLTRETAEAFFHKVLLEVEKGDRILLGAFDDEDRLVGTVQVVTAMPPNQPHRADIAKLLVKRSARGQGVAALLMAEVDAVSREAGKTLLVLDTATGETAERLYERMGWTRVGVIPNYALFPDGRPCDTTFFWKQLA